MSEVGGNRSQPRVYRAGFAPQNLIFDGANIWASDFYGANVTKLILSQP